MANPLQPLRDRERSHSERGAALLTVLLLVAAMATIAAVALERLNLATKLAVNSAAKDQSRGYALAAEALVKVRIDDALQSGNRDYVRWVGRRFTLPLPNGVGSATLMDGGNCFNINSLVSGDEITGFAPRAAGGRQFEALLILLGVDAQQAKIARDSVTDWIDSDSVPSPFGAEDSFYARGQSRYLTARHPIVEVSEILEVQGITPAVFRRIKPWLCALPTTDLSPININSLTLDQAPLLAMLFGGNVPIARAQLLIADRPVAGYASMTSFWSRPEVSALSADFEVTSQVRLSSRWLRAKIAVEAAGWEINEIAIYDAQQYPARIVSRSWGDGG
jgi:general secretion pathway protein K